MQFSVPQFTEVEDKIIGPLTLKQFIILLIAGGVIAVLYKIIGSIIVTIFFALPVAGIALFAAFGNFQGKSMGGLIISGLGFVSEPTSLVFHKKAPDIVSSVKKKPESKSGEDLPQLSPQEKMNRLHNLTYILDQDLKAEEKLLEEKYIHLKKSGG